MDATLHTKIHNKLRTYLNREPSEKEIINGQTDTNLMRWIAQDDADTLKADFIALKSKLKLPV